MDRSSERLPSQGASPPAGGSPGRRGELDLALVVLLGVLWGTAFPVIRAGLVAGAPPLIFASARYFLTAGALGAIAFIVRSPMPPRSTRAAPVVFGGLVMIGVYGGLLYLGEASTSGGLAAILTASAPLLSALFGYRVLPSERFGRGGLFGLLIGFAGVAALVVPGIVGAASSGLVGPWLVVGAVVAFAAGSVLLRTKSRATPGLWLLSVQFAIAASLLGVIALAIGEPMTLGAADATLPALAFLVVFPGILGYSLYFRIHHVSGPSRANLVGYVNPATGVLVGLLVFGEAVTAVEIAGLVGIALGLFLLQRDRRRRAAAPTSGEASAQGKPSPEPLARQDSVPEERAQQRS